MDVEFEPEFPPMHSSGVDSIAAEIAYTVDTGEKPVNETLESGQVIRRRTGATERRPVHRGASPLTPATTAR
jgi:hypothetical protein